MSQFPSPKYDLGDRVRTPTGDQRWVQSREFIPAGVWLNEVVRSGVGNTVDIAKWQDSLLTLEAAGVPPLIRVGDSVSFPSGPALGAVKSLQLRVDREGDVFELDWFLFLHDDPIEYEMRALVLVTEGDERPPPVDRGSGDPPPPTVSPPPPIGGNLFQELEQLRLTVELLEVRIESFMLQVGASIATLEGRVLELEQGGFADLVPDLTEFLADPWLYLISEDKEASRGAG